MAGHEENCGREEYRLSWYSQDLSCIEMFSDKNNNKIIWWLNAYFLENKGNMTLYKCKIFHSFFYDKGGVGEGPMSFCGECKLNSYSFQKNESLIIKPT